VTWTERNAGRADLSTRVGADAELAKDKTADYRYRTGQESAELAKSPDTETSALFVSATLHRNDVDKAQALIEKLVFDQLPSKIAGIVQALAKPYLDAVKARVAALTDLVTTASVYITYHVAAASPSVVPSAGAVSAGALGKTAVWPKTCPSTRSSPRGHHARRSTPDRGSSTATSCHRT
jgi:hypothetical protein